MELHLATQSRCDGSATASFERSESISGVFGPVESRFVDDKVEGTIEVALKNYSSSLPRQVEQDAEYSSLFKDVLESCIKLAPRTTISLSTRILADEGCGVTTAMISAVGALVDAGIPILTIPVAVEVFLLTHGNAMQILVNPTTARLTAEGQVRTRMLMVFANEDTSKGEEETGPLAWLCHGPCSRKELMEAMQSGRDRAIEIRQSIEESLLASVQSNRDLCVI